MFILRLRKDVWMPALMFLSGIATGMVGGALLSLEYPIYWLTFQRDIMSENKKQWKCNFKLEIISKEGASLDDFNASLDKFVSDWIDVIPDTGTAAPESAIDFWHGGLHFPPDDKEQNLRKQNEKEIY